MKNCKYLVRAIYWSIVFLVMIGRPTIGSAEIYCVSFDNLPITLIAPGHSLSTPVIEENGIKVYLEPFYTGSSTVLETVSIEKPTWADNHLVRFNNASLRFEFSDLGFYPKAVFLEFVDAGG